MKIIFLDIDGVLNLIPQGHDEFGAIFHQHLMDNLKRLVDETGALIVISSTWRMSGLGEMQRMWICRGISGKVIDITPHSTHLIKQGKFKYHDEVDRGHEILDWLENNTKKLNITNYVILDDDNDMLPSQMNNFVRTSNNQHHPDCVDIGYGLTQICTDKAIEILNSEDLPQK